MSYWKTHATTTITVSDHSNLLAAWKSYDDHARYLIGNFHVKKPLTEAQLRRLPNELHERVMSGYSNAND